MKKRTLSTSVKVFLIAVFAVLVISAATLANSIFHAVRADEQNFLIRLDKVEFSAEDMNEIISDVDAKTVEEVTRELGSATPNEYVKALAKADPSLEDLLAQKYHVRVDE